MGELLDAVMFTPASTGAGDFVVSAAVQGYMTPAQSGAVDGTIYSYRAESADLSQWEIGYGSYAAGTATLSRTVVVFNSAGSTSKINFSTLPNVGFVALNTDVGRQAIVQRTGAVDIRDYGAVGDNSTVNNTAFAAAMATHQNVYIPNGDFVITDAIAMANQHQVMFGQSRSHARIQVKHSTNAFNNSALGAIVVTAAEPCVRLHDFCMEFEQPVTSVRANLYSYPPAVYMQGVARFEAERLMVLRAINGFDARGNSGGARWESCHMSCYGANIWIDGALDTMRAERCHFYPFEQYPANLSIFYDTSCIGLYSGRCDGLQSTDNLFFTGYGVVLFQGGTGGTIFGSKGDGYDTQRGVYISQCNWANFSSCYFTPSNGVNGSGIYLAGPSDVNVSASTFFGPSTSPFIVTNHAGAYLRVGSSLFSSGSVDKTSIQQIAGECVINGNRFERTANLAMSLQTMIQFAGRMTIQGNTHTDKGTGAGTGIYISAADLHNITGNSLRGWGTVGPGWGVPAGVFANNN